jgi:SAM-dependent methyltransferase
MTASRGEPERLRQSYEEFPRIEDEFRAALDESLGPRGPDLLYELVGGLGLEPGSVAVDVGCGDGKHSVQLAERFGFYVTGLDPAALKLELAEARRASLDPALQNRLSFLHGVAEELPVADESADLVWCRDVLVHVADLNTAYAEFRRVLRPRGRVLVYQTFATERLEPREAAWLWKTMGIVQTSADPARTDEAIAAAGLRLDERIVLGGEWGEWRGERSGEGGRRLLWASRLLRDPDRYVERFGQTAYEIMLGDCLWHVYQLIGTLEPRIYVLSAG